MLWCFFFHKSRLKLQIIFFTHYRKLLTVIEWANNLCVHYCLLFLDTRWRYMKCYTVAKIERGYHKVSVLKFISAKIGQTLLCTRKGGRLPKYKKKLSQKWECGKFCKLTRAFKLNSVPTQNSTTFAYLQYLQMINCTSNAYRKCNHQLHGSSKLNRWKKSWQRENKIQCFLVGCNIEGRNVTKHNSCPE